MKEKLNKERGITLIALVITIIVLLILAIVTIRIVTNENIIGHANNAVTAYNEAQQNELEQLTWAEELMKNKGKMSNETSGTENSTIESPLATLSSQEVRELLNSGRWTMEQIEEHSELVIAYSKDEINENIQIRLMKGETQEDNSVPVYLVQITSENSNGKTCYWYFTDEFVIKGFLGENANLKAKTWYKWKVLDGMGQEDIINNLQEYKEGVFFEKSYFEQIDSEIYFNKILESFNN